MTPITYMASSIEHTIVSQRRNGEVLNLAVQHYDQTNQVHLAVFDGDPDSPEVKQEVELSFEEVLRLLKPLLSRPEIVAILQQ